MADPTIKVKLKNNIEKHERCCNAICAENPRQKALHGGGVFLRFMKVYLYTCLWLHRKDEENT